LIIDSEASFLFIPFSMIFPIFDGSGIKVTK
jgi:hypothetical protein